MQKTYYVYILASRKRGATYIGITNDLARRHYEHVSELTKGYTSKWSIKTLVYFEEFEDVRDAISREKELKKWRKIWKFELIESANPDWRDLSEDGLR